MLPTLAQLESIEPVVHSVLPVTPQYCWPLLCERLGAEVWLKHENHTPVGAFKVRGGLVYFAEVAKDRNVRQVMTATTGNHGQSVAFSAKRYDLSATIVVPFGNSVEKNRAMKALGAKLIEQATESPVSTRLADGMAVRTPDPEALEVIWKYVDRIVEVTDDEIAEAMRTIYECTHNSPEGAGAAAIAAMTKERGRVSGRKLAAVLSGGNVDRSIFSRVLSGTPLEN